MKNHLFTFLAITALAAFTVSVPLTVSAQEKPVAATEAKKDRPIPFSGKINEIDKTAKTIVIGKEKKRTIVITDATKIRKAGKAATFADAVVGDEVGGSYRTTADGKLEAVSLRIGAKPEAPAKEDKKKTDE